MLQISVRLYFLAAVSVYFRKEENHEPQGFIDCDPLFSVRRTRAGSDGRIRHEKTSLLGFCVSVPSLQRDACSPAVGRLSSNPMTSLLLLPASTRPALLLPPLSLPLISLALSLFSLPSVPGFYIDFPLPPQIRYKARMASCQLALR